MIAAASPVRAMRRRENRGPWLARTVRAHGVSGCALSTGYLSLRGNHRRAFSTPDPHSGGAPQARASKREGDLLDASTTWVGERVPFGSLPRFSKDILNQEGSGIRGDTWTDELSGKSRLSAFAVGSQFPNNGFSRFTGCMSSAGSLGEHAARTMHSDPQHRKSLPAVSERRGEVAP